MNGITLRRLCEEVCVSRRAVQGYEKAGLVNATGKNQHGYLLYSEAAVEKVKWIKLMQQLGFSIREISELNKATNDTFLSALSIQVHKLEEERIVLDSLIQKVYQMMDELEQNDCFMREENHMVKNP